MILTNINFILVINAISLQLEDWIEITKSMFSFEILPLTFPVKNAAEWKNLFKPCAAQRLFLPVSCEILLALYFLQYKIFSYSLY